LQFTDRYFAMPRASHALIAALLCLQSPPEKFPTKLHRQEKPGFTNPPLKRTPGRLLAI
jgi:hypothetical protein